MKKDKCRISNRCLLFICTSKPAKITDNKSGILRRLIDVSRTEDIRVKKNGGSK